MFFKESLEDLDDPCQSHDYEQLKVGHHGLLVFADLLAQPAHSIWRKISVFIRSL